MLLSALFKSTIFCYLFVVVHGGTTVDWYNNTTLQRYKRQADNCGFRCKSNDCINEDLACDGVPNCRDGSDESSNCNSIVCPGYLFRCKYGACVEESKKCDGKKDCVDNSDEAGCNLTTLTNNCGKSEFQCKSGQCIDLDFKCNGVADCIDSSDETKDICSKIKCPGYTYRCEYGACVNGNARCNGIKECIDNSDEDEIRCGSKKPPTNPPVNPPTSPINGCIFPDDEPNGKFSIYGNSNNYQAGNIVSEQSILLLSCSKGYKKSLQSIQYCRGREWEPKTLPTCQKLCPEYKSTATTTMHCQHNNQPVSCAEAVHGTTLNFTCALRYEDPSTGSKKRFCSDGTWNRPPPECVPVCGEEFVSNKILIVDGKVVKRGKYPWQVAIYRKSAATGFYKQICGGAIINQNVILSAAHCFTRAEDGAPLPKENYQIAVGKYFIGYNDTRDKDSAQFSDLREIIISEQYRGEIQHYQGDLAILITKIVLKLTNYVQPICIDLSSRIGLVPEQMGVVSGWGFTTASDKPSEVLKELEVPFKSDQVCKYYFPEDWSTLYYTYDKICAGFYNKSASVCKGDSGGALAFRNPKDLRYYIHGIVSVSPSQEDDSACNVEQFALYTSVAKHINLIEDTFLSYAPKVPFV